MHTSEAVEYEICASCGTEVLPTERPYAFEDQVLCYECAIARGGVYDETHDHWDRPPDVSDLLGTTGVL
jgi:hypothetical protein